MEDIKKEGEYSILGWESIIEINKVLRKENKRINGTLFLHCTGCGEVTGLPDCYGKCHMCTTSF